MQARGNPKVKAKSWGNAIIPIPGRFLIHKLGFFPYQKGDIPCLKKELQQIGIELSRTLIHITVGHCGPSCNPCNQQNKDPLMMFFFLPTSLNADDDEMYDYYSWISTNQTSVGKLHFIAKRSLCCCRDQLAADLTVTITFRKADIFSCKRK